MNKQAHADSIGPAKKIIPTVPTITKQKVASGRYALHFSIFYETIVGESISVVGSLEELGLWFDYECQLKWTEGHIWKSTEPVIVNKSYFEYKYVLLQEGQVIGWEEGVNRIADLEALPEVSDAAVLK